MNLKEVWKKEDVILSQDLDSPELVVLSFSVSGGKIIEFYVAPEVINRLATNGFALINVQLDNGQVYFKMVETLKLSFLTRDQQEALSDNVKPENLKEYKNEVGSYAILHPSRSTGKKFLSQQGWQEEELRYPVYVKDSSFLIEGEDEGVEEAKVRIEMEEPEIIDNHKEESSPSEKYDILDLGIKRNSLEEFLKEDLSKLSNREIPVEKYNYIFQKAASAGFTPVEINKYLQLWKNKSIENFLKEDLKKLPSGQLDEDNYNKLYQKALESGFYASEVYLFLEKVKKNGVSGATARNQGFSMKNPNQNFQYKNKDNGIRKNYSNEKVKSFSEKKSQDNIEKGNYIYEETDSPNPKGALFKLFSWIVILGAIIAGGIWGVTSLLSTDGGAVVAESKDKTSSETKVAATKNVEDIIFRMHGSNTVGAKLAPELVKAYLKTQNAKNIQTEVTAENESIISADLEGKRVGVEIKAHGSTTGFKSLKASACDIGMASRSIKDKEVKELSFLGDMTSINSEHVLALDGIAVIVNRQNPIDKLTIDQLAGIFSGEISSWDQIGGSGGTIKVFARDKNSGTFDTFKSLVLKSKKKKLIENAVRIESNADLSDMVSRDENGIGFVGLPYVRDSKALRISDGDATAFYPNTLTVGHEDYPLSRRLFLYTEQNIKNPHVKRFIDFALSSMGQDIAEAVEFVPQKIKLYTPDENSNAPYAYNTIVSNAKKMSLTFRFKFGSDELDNKAVTDTKRVYQYISGMSNPGSAKIILLGFADNIGNPEANKMISEKRARKVAGVLESYGITVSDVVGFGEAMPVASNDSKSGRDKNRRVEIWIKN